MGIIDALRRLFRIGGYAESDRRRLKPSGHGQRGALSAWYGPTREPTDAERERIRRLRFEIDDLEDASRPRGRAFDRLMNGLKPRAETKPKHRRGMKRGPEL